ncbi:MAG: hypothetical protein ACRDHP_14775, partial [Ktedonobacterales bacterium]
FKECSVESLTIFDGVLLVMGIGLIVLGLLAPFRTDLAHFMHVSTCLGGWNVALASTILIFPSVSPLFGISDSASNTVKWILIGFELLTVSVGMFYVVTYNPTMAAMMGVPPRVWQWLHGRNIPSEPPDQPLTQN